MRRGTALGSAGGLSSRSRAGVDGAGRGAGGAESPRPPGCGTAGIRGCCGCIAPGGENRAVLKTGDPASARDRMQLRTQVAALALVGDRGLPAPRVIAADLAGTEAGALAMVTSVLPGSSTIPRAMPAGGPRARRGGGRDSRCRADAAAGPADAGTAAGRAWTLPPAPLGGNHAACWPGPNSRSAELPVPAAQRCWCTGIYGRATRSGPTARAPG